MPIQIIRAGSFSVWETPACLENFEVSTEVLSSTRACSHFSGDVHKSGVLMVRGIRSLQAFLILTNQFGQGPSVNAVHTRGNYKSELYGRIISSRLQVNNRLREYSTVDVSKINIVF